MLQVLMGVKWAWKVHEVPLARPLSTPEFDKKVLWEQVKNNQAFQKLIPENLMGKPRRMPKDWFWRLICKFDPTWADLYS